MEEIKVLAVGPSANRIATGQSIHFNSVCGRLENVQVLHYSRYSLVILDILDFLFRLLWKRVKVDYNVLYYTPSRTNFGSIRDFLTIGFLAYGKNGIKIYAHIHGSEFLEFFKSTNFLIKWFVRWTYKKHEETFVLSNTIGIEISSELGITTKTIFNTIKVEPDADDVFSKKSTQVLTILWCSNLIYSKGFTYFAESILLLPDSYKKFFKIVIIGQPLGDDYKTRSQMNDIVKSYLLKFVQNSIEYSWVGAIPNNEIKKYFDLSHIFILPTFYKTEAMPISVLEAIRSGLKIVLSDWKSLKEIYGNYFIDFIEPRNLSKLVFSLKQSIDFCLTGNGEVDLKTNIDLLRMSNKLNDELLLQYLRK